MPDTPSLNDAAAHLLEQMSLVPPREPGDRLRPEDEAHILELHEQGQTQTEIARIVGCHQSTVSRTVAEYADSRPLARKYLEARALNIAKRFEAEARPADLLRALGKLDVVRDDAAEAPRSNVQVIIGIAPPGTPQNPLPVRGRQE